MKKLLWLFAVVVIATAVKDVIGYFGPMAAAFRAYRDEAERLDFSGAKAKSMGDIEGHIVEANYDLIAAEPAGEDQVRLTVVEAIQFQRGSEMKPFGNRRVAQTRQYVLMRRVEGEWTVSHIEEDATEVVELSDVARQIDSE